MLPIVLDGKLIHSKARPYSFLEKKIPGSSGDEDDASPVLVRPSAEAARSMAREDWNYQQVWASRVSRRP